MDRQDLLNEVGQYIEKYYIPDNDDIKVEDKEVLSFFDKISAFREKRKALKEVSEQDAQEDYSQKPQHEFDASTAKKTDKITHPFSQTMASNRKIEDLLGQMDETFSERLLRMIHERSMSESDTYKKAFVDRRHFSKIKKDQYYVPTKKTVMAFAIALELSLDETKDLMRSAGYALSRSSKFDIIVVYFLQNKIYDMFEINEVLYEYDQPVFG